jgi:hypothetical protein
MVVKHIKDVKALVAPNINHVKNVNHISHVRIKNAVAQIRI